MVYVSEQTHQRIKILAARRKRAMGEVVEDLVEREVGELSNPWLSSAGLSVQQKALDEVWDEPALDVYNDD
jgi:hypothetical protein